MVMNSPANRRIASNTRINRPTYAVSRSRQRDSPQADSRYPAACHQPRRPQRSVLMSNYKVPTFLAELLHARSPSGYEGEAQAVFDRHVKPAADSYANDALGNRIATLNPKGDPVLMLAGHMDELGLIITYVNKDGFIYFDTIGGHDRTVISGRRVIIQTANGPVKGVTGKRAIHLMDEEERKKVPKIHEIWIDIGDKR